MITTLVNPMSMDMELTNEGNRGQINKFFNVFTDMNWIVKYLVIIPVSYATIISVWRELSVWSTQPDPGKLLHRHTTARAQSYMDALLTSEMDSSCTKHLLLQYPDTPTWYNRLNPPCPDTMIMLMDNDWWYLKYYRLGEQNGKQHISGWQKMISFDILWKLFLHNALKAKADIAGLKQLT